ncbi:MAG: hypothetical protein GXP04_00655 [Alphaproteobacteria bacterium]|nr:hypothetical protein [Alphaproteobacteria bacterium]
MYLSRRFKLVAAALIQSTLCSHAYAEDPPTLEGAFSDHSHELFFVSEHSLVKILIKSSSGNDVSYVTKVIDQSPSAARTGQKIGAISDLKLINPKTGRVRTTLQLRTNSCVDKVTVAQQVLHHGQPSLAWRIQYAEQKCIAYYMDRNSCERLRCGKRAYKDLDSGSILVIGENSAREHFGGR